ncbi:ATP-binding protein [Streptomyces sp. NPDC057499]|uniref:ATP-binding protein n=1 Tax=Streptomyces sp. NPDC057499 TaxID=3346150 RepID=UPI003699E1DE
MPLSQQRRFPGRHASVGASRVFVTDVLSEWDLHSLIEDITLCVSELTTNALRHGTPPGRAFRVGLHQNGDAVRLEVRDSGPGQPVIRHTGLDTCSGRGLHIVNALADSFGVDDHVVGKTVWLTFKAPAPPHAR